ncbi:MAG: DUF3726 domain-containing protein [Xanthomonadales bacterium]|nr:DUF3726 domain-containing protein [Xanthomonadales bacterium]NIT32665.1 DUF3726 domain-containing protein [Xanthomonadales bacterium]
MSWSLVEAQTLAVKAARGAGYSWGLAEEAGYALRWLAARGLPGPAALAGLLEGGCAQSGPCPQCPLARGAAIADLGEVPDTLVAVRYPVLLAPFAARLAGGVRLQWSGAEITVMDNGVHSTGDLLSPEAKVAFGPAGASGASAGRMARIPDADAPSIEILLRFAARIYAPASEASRLSGAGAGTTDND